jgi:hypothetical protein
MAKHHKTIRRVLALTFLLVDTSLWELAKDRMRHREGSKLVAEALLRQEEFRVVQMAVSAFQNGLELFWREKCLLFREVLLEFDLSFVLFVVLLRAVLIDQG